MTNVLPGDPVNPVTTENEPPVVQVTTGSDRGRGRDQRILRSGAASAANQIVAAACTVATVPMVIRRLSPEPFGVWVTLSSLLLLLGFLDLGIGSALVGGIAKAQAEGDTEEAGQMISSAFFGLIGLAALFGVLFAALYPHVSWATLLGVRSPAHRGEAALSVAIVVVAILLSLPLNVAPRAQAGLQEGDTVVLWRTIGTVFQLLCVAVLYLLHATLVWFVLALAVGPVAGSLLNSVALFAGERPWLRPRRSKASLQRFRALGSTGFLFFVLLVSSTIAYQSDALIVAHYLGSGKAGEYGVPFRLFMFVPTFVGLALMPLWPAYADAWASGDVAWIRRTFRRSVLFAVSANGGVGLVLALIAQPLLRFWVGGAVSPSTFFIASLFLYVVLWGVSGPIAMLFNGCGVVKFQIVLAVAMVAVNVPLSIALVDPLGVAGPLVGTLVAQTAVVLIPALLYARRLLRSGADEGPVGTIAPSFWRA